ncbi:MAG: hypothetical protein HY769_08310 [Candidatus Stahlbacteria bacterium]|nr:hypothetical protein [Candidatus Stahlbacteria bacterium]
MILGLFLITSNMTTGVGLYAEAGYGYYGSGVGFSLRHFTSSTTALELVIGGFSAGEGYSGISLGGRMPFGIGEAENGYRLVHFIGPALWLAFVSHSYAGHNDSHVGVGADFFYELEVWPSPTLPLSLSIGAGIGFNIVPEFRAHFFIPLGVRFYFN